MGNESKRKKVETKELFHAKLKKPIPTLVREKFLVIVERFSLLFFVLGIVWIFLFPIATVTTGEMKTRGTYFSENALLSGVSEPKFDIKEILHAKIYHNEFVKKLQAESECGAVKSGGKMQSPCQLEIAVNWIQTKLEQFADEVHIQQFFNVAEGKNSTNIYGIVRASPLADGKESIILSGHYSNIKMNSIKTNIDVPSSMAIGLSFLKYLKSVKWLSKDIILLLTDDGKENGRTGYAPGVKKWLEAYHADCFAQSCLPMHAGVIRAGIVIDKNDDVDTFNSIGILGAGINGQLPNLDLVNTAVESVQDRGSKVQIDRNFNSGSQYQAYIQKFLLKNVAYDYHYGIKLYLKNLFGMFRFMKTLITGPSGPHAEFISYNIDSISMSFLATKKSLSPISTVSIRQYAHALENVVRAMSNIEEKLHQSFFFYLLPNTSNFVSVGEYYYSLALIILPAFVQLMKMLNNTAGIRVAFAIGCVIFTELVGGSLLMLANYLVINSTIAYRAAIDVASEIPMLSPFLLSTILVNKESFVVFVWGVSFVVSLFVILFYGVPFLNSCLMLQGACNEATWLTKHEAFESNLEIQDARALGITFDQIAKPTIYIQDNGSRALKCSAMILFVYSHCILGVINYPLAVVCALLSFPLVFIDSSTGFRHVFNFLCLLVASPVPLFSVLYLLNDDAIISSYRVIFEQYNQMGVCLLPYMCLIYFPIYCLSWCIWRGCNQNKAK